MKIELTLPLRIKMAKTKRAKLQFFRLNMNVYKTTNYRTINKAKKLFTEMLVNKLYQIPTMEKIRVHYYIIPANRRMFDTMNFISIFDKFFLDAIVKLGIIADDNYNRIYYGDIGTVDIDNKLVYHNVRVVLEEIKDRPKLKFWKSSRK